MDSRALEILRLRQGLEEKDSSKDESLLKTSPRDVVREICGWEFGDPRWFDTFEKWCKWAGLCIVTLPKKGE